MENEPEYEVRESTPEEVFYFELGNQLARETPAFINQVLRQLVTLSAALLAGSVAFSDKHLVPYWAVATAICLFIVALLASLAGTLPMSASGPVAEPSDIKRRVELVYGRKAALVAVASCAIVASLCILAVCVMFGRPAQ